MANRLAVTLYLLLLVEALAAQPDRPSEGSVEAQGCELTLGTGSRIYQHPYTFREPQAKDLNVSVAFIGNEVYKNVIQCEVWPSAARNAVRHAAYIWSDVLENTQTFHIEACYANNLPPTSPGRSGFRYEFVPGYPEAELTHVPQALYEQKFKEELGPTRPDIWIVVNGDLDYYFGTDANPGPGQYDLVTFIAHEMGHALGFKGSARVDDGDAANGTECTGIANTGCVGYPFSPAPGAPLYPTVFDLFVDAGVRETAVYQDSPNPGTNLAVLLTGSDGSLYFDEGNEDSFSAGADRTALYTPPVFDSTVSYNHFSDPGELMYHTLTPGTAIHDVGTAREALLEMGWPAGVAKPLPVEWVRFEADRSGAGVLLSWTTGQETGNHGFAVEARRATGEFVEIGWVAGSGSSTRPLPYSYFDGEPVPGINYYRLRQTDYDGSFSYSYVVGLHFASGKDGGPLLYPNPASVQTVYLDYLADGPAEVRTQWYDSMGRRAQEGTHSVGAGLTTLPLTVAGLVPGVYVLEVGGTAGKTFHRVVIAR